MIISYVNGIILKPRHLRRATYGAINIHSSPPEHGGCWGCRCQPVLDRKTRTHHGTTVHEVDEQIDHGPIYIAEIWEVPASYTSASWAPMWGPNASRRSTSSGIRRTGTRRSQRCADGSTRCHPIIRYARNASS
jgi:formyltetrahydrofolate hydrolase